MFLTGSILLYTLGSSAFLVFVFLLVQRRRRELLCGVGGQEGRLVEGVGDGPGLGISWHHQHKHAEVMQDFLCRGRDGRHGSGGVLGVIGVVKGGRGWGACSDGVWEVI